MVYTYRVILLSLKKKRNSDTSYNMENLKDIITNEIN